MPHLQPHPNHAPMNTYPGYMMLSSVMLLLASLNLNSTNSTIILEWTLMSVNSTTISFPVMLDPMSTAFMAVVTFISSNVLMFSKTYMHGDQNTSRFTHLLSLFIASMILLILSPNLITMMLGWDGLGFTSFLLVIYYQNTKSLKSGMITALTNRIGDALLLISIGMIMSQGHWSMMNMWPEKMTAPSLPCVLILIAAMTKSAQMPFVAWLPEAMAAPTPVSALVHSSTLVTAGVYILIRLHPFMAQTKEFNSILLTSGLFTSLFGAYWSASYLDQKKAVALSTLSQLGLMMVSLSLNMPLFCFFHLLTHAMFKATLFMGLGVTIISKHHRQNKDNNRYLTFKPLVAAATTMSLLSMNAFFFMAGYYSKEMILETSVYQPGLWFTYLILGVSTAFTMMYTAPLWRVNIFSPMIQAQYPYKFLSRGAKEWYFSGTNKTLFTPMTLMSIGCICVGSVAHSMFITPTETPIMPTHTHFTPYIWVMVGLFLALFFCRLTTKLTPPISAIFNATFESMRLARHSVDKVGDINEDPKMLLSHMLAPYYDSPMPFSMKLFYWSLFAKMKLSQKWSPPHPPTQMIILDKGSFKSAEGASLNQETEQLLGMRNITYTILNPTLYLSLSTLKALDQGVTTLMSAESMKTITPNMSNILLTHQSNQVTNLLLMFMMSTLMVMPFII